jgi:transcription elongation factor Elf1
MNNIKTFTCQNCNKNNKCIIWKKYNNKNLYMCESCWKKDDILLNLEILEKIKKLNINT